MMLVRIIRKLLLTGLISACFVYLPCSILASDVGLLTSRTNSDICIDVNSILDEMRSVYPVVGENKVELGKGKQFVTNLDARQKSVSTNKETINELIRLEEFERGRLWHTPLGADAPPRIGAVPTMSAIDPLLRADQHVQSTYFGFDDDLQDNNPNSLTDINLRDPLTGALAKQPMNSTYEDLFTPESQYNLVGDNHTNQTVTYDYVFDKDIQENRLELLGLTAQPRKLPCELDNRPENHGVYGLNSTIYEMNGGEGPSQNVAPILNAALFTTFSEAALSNNNALVTPSCREEDLVYETQLICSLIAQIDDSAKNQASILKSGTPMQTPSNNHCTFADGPNIDICFLPVVGLVPHNSRPTFDISCSGVIVGDYKILTAAHCVCVEPKFVLLGTGLSGSKSFYKDLSTAKDNKVQYSTSQNPLRSSLLVEIVSVAKLVDKEKSDWCNLNITSIDLAVITTGGHPPFPPYMQALLIEPPSINETINIVGFGPDPLPGANGHNLKRHLSAKITKADDGNQRLLISSEQGNSCPGDSGSPAVMRLSNGRLGVFAILSAGAGGKLCPVNEASTYLTIKTEHVFSFLQSSGVNTRFENDWVAAHNSNKCLGLRCKL